MKNRSTSRYQGEKSKVAESPLSGRTLPSTSVSVNAYRVAVAVQRSDLEHAPGTEHLAEEAEPHQVGEVGGDGPNPQGVGAVAEANGHRRLLGQDIEDVSRREASHLGEGVQLEQRLRVVPHHLPRLPNEPQARKIRADDDVAG